MKLGRANWSLSTESGATGHLDLDMDMDMDLDLDLDLVKLGLAPEH